MIIGQQLNFDMTRMSEILFDENGAIAKGRLSLARGGFERILELRFILDHAHPAAATAGCRFHQNGIFDAIGETPRRRRIGGFATRHDRDFSRDREAPRRDLVPQRRHYLGGRTDEDQSGIADRAREAGPFGQEAITGMNRAVPGVMRSGKQRFGVEVALGAGSAGPIRRASSAASTCAECASAAE